MASSEDFSHNCDDLELLQQIFIICSLGFYHLISNKWIWVRNNVIQNSLVWVHFNFPWCIFPLGSQHEPPAHHPALPLPLPSHFSQLPSWHCWPHSVRWDVALDSYLLILLLELQLASCTVCILRVGLLNLNLPVGLVLSTEHLPASVAILRPSSTDLVSSLALWHKY